MNNYIELTNGGEGVLISAKVRDDIRARSGSLGGPISVNYSFWFFFFDNLILIHINLTRRQKKIHLFK